MSFELLTSQYRLVLRYLYHTLMLFRASQWGGGAIVGNQLIPENQDENSSLEEREDEESGLKSESERRRWQKKQKLKEM